MGLLDGGLQQMFGAAFGTLLLEGRHYRYTESRAPNGDVSAPLTKVQSVRGYRETTRNRRSGDEGSGDAIRFLVLQTYDGRVIDPVQRGDVVAIDGLRIRVADSDEDAAHTHWLIEGTPE
jgi:hypothetical protein